MSGKVLLAVAAVGLFVGTAFTVADALMWLGVL